MTARARVGVPQGRQLALFAGEKATPLPARSPWSSPGSKKRRTLGEIDSKLDKTHGRGEEVVFDVESLAEGIDIRNEVDRLGNLKAAEFAALGAGHHVVKDQGLDSILVANLVTEGFGAGFSAPCSKICAWTMDDARHVLH